MRTYKILFYTDDKKRFASFKNNHRKDFDDTMFQGVPVCLIDSFKGVVPRFKSSNDLTIFLSEYKENLSDLIIIVDTAQLKRKAGDSQTIRKLIIEYPEIKFLFDSNPKRILFNKNEILKCIRSASRDTCEKCIVLLKNSTKHHKVKQSFVSALKPQEQSNTKVELSVCNPILFRKNKPRDEIASGVEYEEAWEILRQSIRVDEDYILEDVRDVRKQLVREIAVDSVNFDLITLPSPISSSNIIQQIVFGYDNLFDASNLRYAIKQWKYAELDVHAQNFRSTQESRRDSLALCIEEERGQNRFNSYCLFANGYRVLPILSAEELLRVSTQIEQFKPSLIVRDYDLQFPDQHTVNKVKGNLSYLQGIDKIRGYRYAEKEQEWKVFIKESEYWNGYYLSESNDTIGFSTIPVLFITKGGHNIKLKRPSAQKKEKYISYQIHRRIAGEPVLLLPGLSKPISGIHRPFFCVKQIKHQYETSREHKRPYFNTSREGHQHGTSLDIYSMVKSILLRADYYYRIGKYIHAAILSNEAIEYLNGFHQSLMIQAYYINSVAENAISLDAMGVDEEKLTEDAFVRINKIHHDIMRVYAQKGLSKRTIYKLSHNTLNQIYSDCRSYCREKEHFKAEEAFISAMSKLNEGLFFNE